MSILESSRYVKPGKQDMAKSSFQMCLTSIREAYKQINVKHEIYVKKDYSFDTVIIEEEPKPLDVEIKNEITVRAEQFTSNSKLNHYTSLSHKSFSNKDECSVRGKVEETSGVNRNNEKLNIRKEIDYFNNCMFETEIEIFRNELDAETMSEDEVPTPSFEFSQCQKSFKTKRQITNHILSVHDSGNGINGTDNSGDEEYNNIDYVKKASKKNTNSKSNLIRRKGEGRKSYAKLSGLKTYKRVHTDKKAHICFLCEKTFSQKSSLRIHYRIHTGVKPYSCHVCRKSFSQLSGLKSHERVHTGEKSYQLSTDIRQKNMSHV